MTEIREASSPLVSSDLDEVEEKFGFKFPTEFRDFYLEWNGGRPTRDRLFLEDQQFVVHQIIPIKHKKSPRDSVLEEDISVVKVRQTILPAHLFPFAVDPGGGYFCWSARPEEFGAIYFYRQEFSLSQREPIYLGGSLGFILEHLVARSAT